MSEGYNFRHLKAEILALSKATDWETARKEWALVDIIEAEEPEACLCGHFPIVEICAIHNRVTGHSTEVGNVCVKRFLETSLNSREAIYSLDILVQELPLRGRFEHCIKNVLWNVEVLVRRAAVKFDL